MATFNEQKLVSLIRQTCQQPHRSLERQEGLTEIVRSIQGKLWKDSSPHYQDALQRTWFYFCRNLCEATTAPQFDPERASVITWLNAYLKGELKKAGWQDGKTNDIIAGPVVTSSGEIIDPLDTVPAPSDLPPMLEITREWAEIDPSGELRRIHLKENSKVTCQVVVLRRLPPETPWKVLSDEFNVPIATLSTFIDGSVCHGYASLEKNKVTYEDFMMTKTVNDVRNQALVLPLTNADYAIAQQWAARQPTPQKVEQVRLNTLAVSAVQTYLQMMDIPTDLEASESRNPFLSLCNDVADLVVTDVGHLECRPVRLHEQTCHIPAEVWDDRIGYVAVEIDEALKEAAILGFTPEAEAEAFPLNQLQPLQQLLRHLSQLSSPVAVVQAKLINQPQVNLGQWLENVFEDGWQSIEALLGVESRNLAFSLRDLPSPSADEVSQSKLLNLEPGSESETVLLLVSLKAEIDEKIRVRVQIHPVKGNTLVPLYLKLVLLSDSEEILQSVQAQSQDNYIQLKPFKCSVGTHFKLHISLNDFSVMEEFLV